MLYLIERNGSFYFNRRVQTRYSHLDKREVIREALNTRDKRIGLPLAIEKSMNQAQVLGEEHGLVHLQIKS